jgi:sulfite exporter TauE/SafE
MMSIFITAFIIGGLGSVHCIGMCGPLAFSLPAVKESPQSKFISSLLYNLGRIFTYASLGAILGTIGTAFAFFGYQQWLSILLGVIILLFILLPKRLKSFTANNRVAGLFDKARMTLGSLFFKKNYRSVFFIGLLNGLLPCGLVYMAMAAAIATGSVVKSSLFMAAFGMGTLPVMWSISFFGSYINMNVRTKIRKAYPYMMLIMACLLIIRGMGLGVPYLSPATSVDVRNGETVIQCNQ